MIQQPHTSLRAKRSNPGNIISVFHMLVMATMLLMIFSASTTANASCLAFVPTFEKKYDLPPGLLKAILTVESRSTPWAVNTSNSSRFFKKKDDAVQHIQHLKKSGCGNINVGCAQLNVPSHAHHFKSIGHLIDPSANVAYAARLLRKLYNRYGTWEKAVQRYNSGTNGRPYQVKVWRVWKKQQSEVRSQVSEIRYQEPKTKSQKEILR